MKKQKWTPGAVVEIRLQDGTYTYAQLLKYSLVAFFDLRLRPHDKLDASVILQKKVLFITTVYSYAVSSGRWMKVGKIPIRADIESVPRQFIKSGINEISYKLYDPNTGEIQATSREECIGLECAAVWEGEHIEKRLIDHFYGRPNKWDVHVNNL